MFPLILGISLGVFLLMVILFLIMELVETYPVWKQFKGFYSTHRAGFPSRENRNSQKWKTLLLSLAGIGAIALICYLLSQQPTEEKRSQVKAETATINVPVKNLSAPSADSAILFRLKTKWEDGKLYGNSTVAFATEAVPRFNNCRFYLLDKDGFLIKAVFFLSNDFLFATGPDGNVQFLLNKFSMELSVDDYLKIDKLQVALDGKISSEEK